MRTLETRVEACLRSADAGDGGGASASILASDGGCAETTVQAIAASAMPAPRFYLVFKRTLDLLVALFFLIALWPVMAIIALLIRLSSPGPALFVQVRIGRGGRLFRMFKFRTLQSDPDASVHRAFMQAFVKGQIRRDELGHVVFKPIDESQVTSIGRILRTTSLDELPQLLNVVKGDMSLVGPRPNVPWEVEAYEDWHMERLTVLPGMTGLAQVHGRSGLDFDTIARYDIEYARHQSLKLDLQILAKTVLAVVSRNGAQ